MTPEHKRQIKDIYRRALELTNPEREEMLQRVCGGDEELRHEVEVLLSESMDTNPYLNTEAIVAGAPKFDLTDKPGPQVGERIGPYRLVGELGRGGMGTVFLADRDDEHFQKRVAVKIVKRGMDTVEILSRFRHERQILASLEHPNIAQLLDGGTTADGLPYFVMEHIEGQPIDKYCTAHKLSMTEKLQLFRTVCASVHYAHQNLVIHRDLKPANILVTNEGAVKLLDFGIAKILNPEGFPETILPTRTWDRPMTPAYASPEQAKGQLITTASDVYSLGVVLYELLTGQRPYRVEGYAPHEIAKVVCETEPEKPSTAVVHVVTRNAGGIPTNPGEIDGEKLRRQLKGDLDNIVLMALRKEPNRRYLSAEQFSEDIRRHLEGRPVIARQDTIGYRVGKFVRRNKVAVVAASLIAASLVGGIVMTLGQARIAERRFNDVRKLANAVLFKYHDAVQNLPGSTSVREMMVKDALEYLDNLSSEAGSDRSLQRELASAYEKIGSVQGHPFHANLGDRNGALQSYRKSLAMRQALVAAEPSNTQNQNDLAMSHIYVGDMLGEMGDVRNTLENYRRAMQIFEGLSKDDPSNVTLHTRVGICQERVAEALAHSGDFKGALDLTLKSLAIAEKVYAAKPSDKREYQNLSISYIKLGDRFVENRDYLRALANYRKAAAIHEELARGNQTNAEVRRELALIYDNIGVMLIKTNDAKAALTIVTEGKKIREELAAADPNNDLLRNDLTLSYDFIGDALAELGKYNEAMQSYRKSLTVRQAVVSHDPKFTDALRYTAIVYNKIGDLLFRQRDYAGALQSFLQAAPIAEKCIATDSANVEFRADLAGYQANIGKAHAALAVATANPSSQQLQMALTAYQRSAESWRYLSMRGAITPEHREAMDKVLSEVAKCEDTLRHQ